MSLLAGEAWDERVHVATSADKGRHCVATADIAAGETLCRARGIPEHKGASGRCGSGSSELSKP